MATRKGGKRAESGKGGSDTSRRSKKGARKGASTSALQAAKTAANKTTFLEQFKATGTITGAARATGIHRDTHYEWLQLDADYLARFTQAEVEAVDLLETEARRRALVGTERGVYYQGRKIDTYKETSDTLLIFLLKGRRPDIYRDRFEHTGKGGGPIETMAVPLDGLTDEELALARRLAEKAALSRQKPETEP